MTSLGPEDLPLGMTDLEEQLRGPDGASVRDNAVEIIEAAIRRIHGEQSAGLGPDEYEKATKTREGLAVARSLLLAYPIKS